MGHLCVALLVPAEQVLGLGVSKSATADQVHPYQPDKCDQQDYVGSPPLFLEVGEQAGLAGVTVVAELGLIVAPLEAVHVSRGVYRADPVSRVDERVPTFRRWLTTP